MTRNEDFLFAQEAMAQGFVTEAQVEEALLLQRRMAEDLKLDERLGVILVKRGYLAEDQARRVYARIDPDKQGEIRGYRLLDVVGRGAMGTVYRALHLGLNRVVALKILRPDLRSDKTQIERLKAEAAMLASLDHPNVVRALDAGESNGYPYFVMEYVEGETLRDRLRREGALPEDEALHITRGVADALERARRMGIVHRDVKPGNVLLAKDGTPKLMDLGLAKGPIDLGLTQHGATVGTPQYISPEQAVDPKKADTRSDIYGLGATLYAMLCGEPPFDGQTLAEILTKVLYEAPVPVRTRRPQISPEAGYLVERMMLKDPTLRHRTPAAVVADIDRIEQGTSILPKGFTGSWEGWLLRARTRRLATVGAATVVAGVLAAFGVRFVLGQVASDRERDAVEDAISLELSSPALSPDDHSDDVRRRLDRVVALERRAAAVEASNHDSLRRRVTDLDQEVLRFEQLDLVRRRDSDPALESGEWATAAGRLEVAVDRIHESGSPARRRGEARLKHVRDASDEALRDARTHEFAASPATFDAARAALERWLARLARYADTALAREETRLASDAAQASRQIQAEIDAAAAAVAGTEVRRLVEDLRFTEARDLVEGHRARARGHLENHRQRLQVYFGSSTLAPLVEAPFDAALEALGRSVASRFAALAAEADALDKARRPAEGVALVRRVEEAARAAFPAVAYDARSLASGLERSSAAQIAQTEADWESLFDDVRDAIRAGDAARIRARVAQGRRSPPLVAARRDDLARLAESADLLEDFWGRVASGLEARVGAAKERWIETVPLANGEREHKWEVSSVDRARRVVRIVSHSGNIQRREEARAFDELHPDFLASLADLRPDAVPRDAAVHALYLLSRLPHDETDFDPASDPYARREAYRRVQDRLQQAERDSGPLARWIAERRERLSAEGADLEARAREMLENAEAAYAQRDNAAAWNRFNALLEPPLSHAVLVKKENERIVERRRLIKDEDRTNFLALLVPGAKVRRLQGEAVELLLDFDTMAQGENFREGSAMFVPGPGASPVTPGGGQNQRLRLLPARDGGLLPEGWIVPDRPLAMPSPFDPTRERSISFHLWVYSPFFLGLDLDGVQCGVLSADPRRWGFESGVPTREDERRPPAFDFYGRGRGVVVRAGRGFGDPRAWSQWTEGNHGRHFVPPDRDRESRKAEMTRRWFAFDPQDRPYRVRFVHTPPSGTVRLEVDEQEVWAETGSEWKKTAPSGLLQILSFTTCDVDDLVLRGHVSETWRHDAMERTGLTERSRTEPGKPPERARTEPAKPPERTRTEPAKPADKDR